MYLPKYVFEHGNELIQRYCVNALLISMVMDLIITMILAKYYFLFLLSVTLRP